MTLLLRRALAAQLGVGVSVRRMSLTPSGLVAHGLAIANPPGRSWIGPDALYIGRVEVHTGGLLSTLALLGLLRLKAWGIEVVVASGRRRVRLLQLHDVRLTMEHDGANLTQLAGGAARPLGAPRVPARAPPRVAPHKTQRLTTRRDPARTSK